jgi:uncharacterized OsmC-like protein
MINIGKIISNFAKIKTLKLHAESLPDGIAIHSDTHTENWESHSPMETYLGSLAACELSVLRMVTSHGPVKFKSMKFTRLESSYHTENFLKGGKNNKLDDIFVEAEVTTTGTQADLDALHEKVKNMCPIFQMMSASGITIHNTWKNIQVAE